MTEQNNTVADILDIEPSIPCSKWYETLDWVKFWFEREKAFHKRYSPTYDLVSGRVKWYDNKEDGADKELMYGSFDDMVDWITFDIQKHHPLVNRDIVKAYAMIDQYEYMCCEYDSKEFEKTIGK